ncbi:MAG: type II toxin-antitoxin system RelE/ParE family toxin [Burkholderiales bacterium]
MARIVYSENALGNIERAFEFLAEHDPGIAAEAVEAIRHAVDMLGAHPFVGRRVEGELRELVISFGRTGYVALYRYLSSYDVVRILAIRHQRELDYPD